MARSPDIPNPRHPGFKLIILAITKKEKQKTPPTTTKEKRVKSHLLEYLF